MMERYKIVSKLIFIQILLMGLVAIFFGTMSGWVSAVSAVLGGLTGVVPGIFFILVYFKHTHARAARKVVQAFYLGEVLKLLITVVLFTASFQWSKLKPLPLFMAFIATQITYWLVLLIYEQHIRIHPSSSRTPGSKD